MSIKFTTCIFQKGNNLGIEVPQQVIDQLGAGRRPAVLLSIAGYSYRSTVGVMQGKYLIPLNSAHRKFVHVNGGDQLEVDIELDEQPRLVDIPVALAERLAKSEQAKHFFEGLAPSSKKKIVLLLDSAKKEETLTKRLDKIISDLEHGLKP